jgi:hypothetical protein
MWSTKELEEALNSRNPDTLTAIYDALIKLNRAEEPLESVYHDILNEIVTGVLKLTR